MLSINRKVRVLGVDDSAVARTFLTRGLSSYPNIEVVGYAVNALDARGKISSLAPDVMTLDVEMPGTNGIDFLKELLPVTPLPVILVSSLNLKVFDALAAGAVDFVRKPDGTESKQSFLDSLAQKIVVASCAKVRRRAAVSPAAPSLSSVSPAGVGGAFGSGSHHHRPGRFHRGHRSHPGSPEAPPCRYPRHGDRPAHAGGFYQDVCGAA